MSRAFRSLLVAIPSLFLLATECTPAPGNGGPTDASQGWGESERIAWYTASQGSRLIPRAWLDALEQPDGTGPFLDPAYIATFRYLPNPNPAGKWASPDPSCPYDPSLPLGFTLDCQSGTNVSFTQLQWKANQSRAEPWVGLNCSACHTTEMTFKGSTFRADGGPSLTDFQSFTAKLGLALRNTASDQQKFDRFVTRLPQADPAMLKTALGKWTAWNNKLDALNDPNHDDPAHRIPDYGFGRLDAIGHIYNKISLLATPASISHQIANPADAPTSFPFLWNVPQLDRVEWNGIASNTVVAGVHVGALGRNTGEVIGVFGDIAIKKDPGLGGYNSSVLVKRLDEMEAQLAKLQPPKWPAAFGAVDTKLADTGRGLFAQRCATCHTVPTKPQGDLTEQFKVTLQPVFPVAGTNQHGSGTDFWMACNAVLELSQQRSFQG